MKELHQFLMSAFEPGQFDRFLRRNDFVRVSDNVSLQAREPYFFCVVEELQRRNLINDELFEHLREELPDRTDEIDDLEKSVLGGSNGPGPTEPPESLYTEIRPYLHWMQRRSSKLPLAPLDPSGRDSALIGLNDVFVALDVDKDGQTKLGDGADAVYSAAIGHLHENSRLILLGDPGSGKSTLLRYLALCLCNALLEEETEWLGKLHWAVREKQEEGREGARLFRDQEEKIEQRRWQETGLAPVFTHKYKQPTAD